MCEIFSVHVVINIPTNAELNFFVSTITNMETVQNFKVISGKFNIL